MNDQLPAVERTDRGPDTIETIHDTHAGALFQYCCFMLHDTDAAQAALCDTLIVVAAHLARQPDPAQLLPWLYALARIECTRRRPSSAFYPEPQSARPSNGGPDPALIAWHAVMGIGAPERESLELSFRHDLTANDIASVLGIAGPDAAALLARGRAALEHALAAEVLAHTRAVECRGRVAILSDWDGNLTSAQREQLVQHARRCALCAQSLPRSVSVAKVFDLLPMPDQPADTRSRTMACLHSPEKAEYRAFVVGRAAAFDDTGFPVRPAGAAVAAEAGVAEDGVAGVTEDRAADVAQAAAAGGAQAAAAGVTQAAATGVAEAAGTGVAEAAEARAAGVAQAAATGVAEAVEDRAAGVAEAADVTAAGAGRSRRRRLWVGLAAVSTAIALGTGFALASLGGFGTMVGGIVSGSAGSRAPGGSAAPVERPGQVSGTSGPTRTSPRRGGAITPGALLGVLGPHGPAQRKARSASPPALQSPRGVPPSAGQLRLSSGGLDLGAATEGRIVLSADGGPVTWSASTSSPKLSLSSYEGTLAAGARLVLAVMVTSGWSRPGRATVIIGPGNVTVAVTWSGTPGPAPSPPGSSTPAPTPSGNPSAGSPPAPSPSPAPSSSVSPAAALA